MNPKHKRVGHAGQKVPEAPRRVAEVERQVGVGYHEQLFAFRIERAVRS